MNPTLLLGPRRLSLRLPLCGLLLIIGGLLPAQLLAQTIRYVKPSATGTGNGSSWANASGNLQAMINASNPNHQVWVARGTYLPSPEGNPRISFSMKNGVSIYGGFVGTETALAARPAVNPITGNPSSSTLSGAVDPGKALSIHVIANPPGIKPIAVLDGFVITAGFTPFDPNRDYLGGGGMYNDHASPTLRNCSFVKNYSGDAGGAIYNLGAGSGGDSIDISNPVLTNCLFENNSARAGGGAIYNNGAAGQSSPVLTNCSFVDNYAGSSGGAMGNNGSTNGQSSPVLTNCSFLANEANESGGAMLNNGFFGHSSPVLTNCSFLANKANESGGAIYNYGASAGESNPVLTNCALQANSAPQGGAIYNEIGIGGRSNPVLTNCVLFNNGGSNTFVNSNASGSSATYSLFDNTNGVNVSGPGNLTTTTSPFTSATSVTLNACSPAIDAGDKSVSTPASDLAGNPRRVRTIDMGAYEFQGTPTVLVITRQPASARSVCVGTPVSVSVVVSGASPTFQWYKDNAPLDSQTAPSLSLPNTTTANAGSYYVVVTGCNSVTSTAFSLTVNAPSVNITPSSTTLSSTSPTASLTATGTGTFRWSTGETTPVISVSATGPYSVTLTAPGGCSASASASVTFLSGVDLTPSLNLPQANFAPSGPESIHNLTMSLNELGGHPTSGQIVLTLTAPLGYSLGFDGALSSINITGGTTNPVSVNNASWEVQSRFLTQLTLVSKAGQGIGANGVSVLGLSLTRSSASVGSANLTVNVTDDASQLYDSNPANNIFARILNSL